VIFVPGNHDEFARGFVGHHFGGVEVVSEAVHETADGKRLWSYQTPGNGRVLGVVNGVVYGETFAASSSENAAVFALNASDGSVRWNHQTSGFSGGGLLAEGVIYEEVYHQGCSCSTPPSYQLALNASDGSVKWQTPQTNDHFSFQMAASGLLYGLEAGGEGPVANLQVRSASTGSVAWQFPTSPDTAMVDIIGMANGVVYLTSNDGDFSNFPSTPTIIYALNATTGATFWRTPLPGTVPVIATLRDQVVYLGDTDGSALTALNASDGKQLWKTSLGTPGSATNQVITASVVSNGIVYVSLPGGFAALKASDGSVQWKAPASGYASVLAVQGGLVYGSTNNTNTYPNGQNAIYALKASDGSSVWTYAVPAIFSPPVVG
jgi:outer membrane protein assembly factor BamB